MAIQTTARRSSTVRIGSALFNADHTRLAEELRRVEAAGIDFWHLDVFDGHFVPDLAFPIRTVKALRPLSRLPFEIHLAAVDPLRFVAPLADAGADLVFLPAESCSLIYEAIYAVRERGMKVGLCLALGTPLPVLEPALPLLDSVLLLARVTGEGKRGREFNPLALERVRQARRWIDERGLGVELQVAGGLETDLCRQAVEAGASALPLGGSLHREADPAAFLRRLYSVLLDAAAPARRDAARQAMEVAAPLGEAAAAAAQTYRVLNASRSFGKSCPEVPDKMRAAGCELVATGVDGAPTEEQMLGLVGDVDAIISGTEPITARVIEAAPRLKVISKHGVGYENIDLAAARARGIPVAIAAGAISDSVADHAMGLILSLARSLPQDCQDTRQGQWKRSVGVELRGKTLGIVGLGQIGRALACRAFAFGMTVVANDAFEDAAYARAWGVRYLPLEELLGESDFVSLHAPVTPETRRLMDARRLAVMKPTAYLVNTARGELVDEEALYQALASGRLAGAASDVFAKEPPRGSPLLSLPNFIPTAHNAGQTVEGLRRMGEITAENALRVLRGEEPLFRVA